MSFGKTFFRAPSYSFFAKMMGRAIITVMSQPKSSHDKNLTEKAPASLWKSILLLIIFVFLAVSLFGAIIFLFISGAQQMGWPPVAHLVIFVAISGIFAWLVKRITDIISGMSQRWFPEEVDPGQ